MPIPSDKKVSDVSKEIENCLWRSHDASLNDTFYEWLSEVDSEVMDILRHLNAQEALVVMDRIVSHLENSDGMPPELMEEVFNNAIVSRQDLNAFRLSRQTPQAQAARPSHRI